MKKLLKKMLKKVIHIIIAMLLLVTTAGFTVSKHFCGNLLVSVSMSSSAESCDSGQDRDCCHDSSAHFQVEDNFTLKQVSFIPDIPVSKDSFFKVFNITVEENSTIENHPATVNTFYRKEHQNLSLFQCYLL